MIKNEIDSSASVHTNAELCGVKVGPHCVISENVRIGKGTELVSHVHIEGDTWIGEGNLISSYVSIGTSPQSLRYAGEKTKTIIGDHNVFREAVTVHRGTQSGKGQTKIGNHCTFSTHAHVAHDCVIEDHVTLGNSAHLGGHVLIEPFAHLNSLAAVHQFCRVGRHAFLSTGTMISLDVPPFCSAEGRRAGLIGIDADGLLQHGLTHECIQTLQHVYHEFFHKGHTLEDACALFQKTNSKEVDLFVKFIQDSERGIIRPLWNDSSDDRE